jgi:hypothetical protein
VHLGAAHIHVKRVRAGRQEERHGKAIGALDLRRVRLRQRRAGHDQLGAEPLFISLDQRHVGRLAPRERAEHEQRQHGQQQHDRGDDAHVNRQRARRPVNRLIGRRGCVGSLSLAAQGAADYSGVWFLVTVTDH